MHSPSPSLMPPSSASFCQQPLANESLDHMLHSTSVEAGPFREPYQPQIGVQSRGENCATLAPSRHPLGSISPEILDGLPDKTQGRYNCDNLFLAQPNANGSNTAIVQNSQTGQSSTDVGNDFGGTNFGAYVEATNDSLTEPTHLDDAFNTDYGVNSYSFDTTKDLVSLHTAGSEHGISDPNGFNSTAPPLLLHDSVHLRYGTSGPSVYDFATVNTHNSAGTEHGMTEPAGFDSAAGALQFDARVGLEYGMSTSKIFDNSTPNSFCNNQSCGYPGLVDQPGLAEPWVQPSLQPSANPPFMLSPMPNPIQHRTQCPWIGCTESFARFTDIQRHWDSVHLGIRYHCFWVGCPNNAGNGYCRLEKLRTHQKQKHGFALM